VKREDHPIEVPARNCWAMQTHIDDTWSAIGFFWLVNDGWRLGELRIIPRAAGNIDSNMNPLEHWLDGAATLEALPPDHSIYGEVLRRVPLAHMKQSITDLVQVVKDSRIGRGADGKPDTAFRQRLDALELPDERPTDAQLGYLLVAKTYAEAVAQGRTNPNPLVGYQLGLDPTQVRDRLTFARKSSLGYLEPTGPRRAGGQLTPLGRELAERYESELRKIQRRWKREKRS
jgi:hypothetical protein